MIKLVVFDWDDTICRGAKEGYFQCYHEAVIGVGVHLDPEEEKRRILAKWGKTHVEELEELLREHPELVAKADDIYKKHLFGKTYIEVLSPISGANESLLSLEKNYILTVVTGAHPKIVKEKVIPALHIPNVFSALISNYELADSSKHKPHPYALLKLMEEFEAKPEETVVVGDARIDVEFAHATGVTPIVVLTGNLNEKEAAKLGVEYIIPDVTHLEKVLEKINGTV